MVMALSVSGHTHILPTMPLCLCGMMTSVNNQLAAQVLQVVEALLKQGDLLTASTPPEMPGSSAAALFLCDLVLKAGSCPTPGKVLR